MEDYTHHTSDGTLIVGNRYGSIVVCITKRDGTETRISLPPHAARKLGEWCSKNEVEEATPYQILRAGTEALGALEAGKFERRTSSEFWSLGFDVNSDSCEWHVSDEWCAIHDPHENEIEVYVMGPEGHIGAATVSVGTGQVVRL